MFHRETDASKAALVGLVEILDDGEEQVVLRGEVVVDHADARARVVGDAPERSAVHPLVQKALARGVEHAPANVTARSRHQPSFF